MGQVVIDVPQNVFRSYLVDDSEFSEKLMLDLDKNSNSKETHCAIVPPRRNSMSKDGDAVVGIWADRDESADEIARKIREGNRRIT